MTTIGERLKSAIDRLNSNTRLFSDLVRVPYQTLHQYLSGRRKPSSEALVKIASHSTINLNWLLTGVGEPFRNEEAKNEDLDGKAERLVSDILYDLRHNIALSEEEAKIVEDLGLRAKAMAKAGELEVVKAADPNTPASKLGIHLSVLADLERTEAGRLLNNLDLGRRGFLAKKGTQGTEWHILTELVERLPMGLSLERLCQELQTTENPITVTSIAPELRALLQTGLVREVIEVSGKEPLYFAATKWADLRTASGYDQAQHGMEAVRILMKNIVPTAELSPRDGALVTACVSVRKGRARACLREIQNHIRSVLLEEGVDEGGEEITVVLGLALSELPK